MSACDLETSALVEWLLDGREAASVRERLESAETIVTSDLTWAETERVLDNAEALGL